MPEPHRTVRDCDLCIVGAGYAALNGLNAAAKYMNRGERVVVVDKRASWGGQWNDQYDFVRLHQPYAIAWRSSPT
jgi:cation diffusion facilitator CzcD-associated flavoprotein CzcO